MPDRTVVRTRYGSVRGTELEGVVRFAGIPYAEAPGGLLGRFGPPVPPKAWSGERDGSEFGPIAPQAAFGPGSYLPGDPTAQAEECRVLNVWAPAERPGGGGGLPVLVFVHGGTFLTGSGSSTLYRGERLAREGVVVVTLNYRLGALGFLAHPALAHRGVEGCGNFGLADQLAALAFLRDHAGAFGGDPARVTVFGESAGAMSVAALLAMPAARGLFGRAVLESGMAHARSLEMSARLAEELAELLGIELTRERLVEVPLAELLEAQQELTQRIDEGLGMPFGPVVDGGLLPAHPADLIAAGAGSPGAEVMGGTNRDEFSLFSQLSPLVADLDEAGLESLVTRYLHSAGLPSGPTPGEVLARYRGAREPRGEPTGPRALLDAFATDWIFRLPLLRLLEAHGRHGSPTYGYLFDWCSPFGDGSLGSCHGLELPFVFGTVHEPLIGLFAGSGEEAFGLSAAIREAWTSFAATGDPSTERLGPWPAYEPSRRATMVLGPVPGVVEAPREEERRFWEAHLGRYGQGGPAEGAVPRSVAFLGPLPEAGSSPPAAPPPAGEGPESTPGT